MDEFNYLQYLNDTGLKINFSVGRVDFDDYFGDISSPSIEEGPCDPESRKTETNDENSAAPEEANYK